MSIKYFKEIADIKQQLEIYKPQYQEKKKSLNSSETNKIKTAFESYFSSIGFTISNTDNKVIAFYSGQKVILEIKLDNEHIVLSGSVTVGSDILEFKTYVVEPDVKPDNSHLDDKLSAEEKELIRLKNEVEYYKDFDPNIYRFNYLLWDKRIPQPSITSNPRQVQRPSAPKKFKTFDELLLSEMS